MKGKGKVNSESNRLLNSGPAALREAIRRLERKCGKGSPNEHGFCPNCGQNELYRHSEIVSVLNAIADWIEQ